MNTECNIWFLCGKIWFDDRIFTRSEPKLSISLSYLHLSEREPRSTHLGSLWEYRPAGMECPHSFGTGSHVVSCTKTMEPPGVMEVALCFLHSSFPFPAYPEWGQYIRKTLPTHWIGCICPQRHHKAKCMRHCKMSMVTIVSLISWDHIARKKPLSKSQNDHNAAV